MDVEDNIDIKDFLDESLDIKDQRVKTEITGKLEQIKTVVEKIANLKNVVDDKNLTVLLINQNITRLQVRVDALKKEVSDLANKQVVAEEIKK